MTEPVDPALEASVQPAADRPSHDATPPTPLTEPLADDATPSAPLADPPTGGTPLGTEASPDGAEAPPDAAPRADATPGAGEATAETGAPASGPEGGIPPADVTECARTAELPADAGLVELAAIAPAVEPVSLTRRAFLGFGLALAGGISGAAALAQLFPVFASAEDQASPLVPNYNPESKAWTFVVDTAKCIGCGLCVVACKEENHVPESIEFTRTWVERHTTMTDGTRYVDAPDAGINGFPATCTAPGSEGRTAASSFFQPRLCMQCEDSPCTAVCPVSATYRTEDGVILVDARRCIGCGFCVVSCPYGARYITPADEDSPANTPGIADKCTWCYHRISRGQRPACVEICPVGARRFGDANDPTSDIAAYAKGGQPLHPEYGTRPRVLYLGPTLREA